MHSSRALCLAEGALSGVLYCVALWFPPVGFLLCVLSPLPLATAGWRNGLWGALGATAAGAALVAAAVGYTGAAMYAAQFAAGGCALGLAAKKGRPPEAVVGAYAAATIAGLWIILGVMAVRSGTSPDALLASAVGQAAEQAREMLLRADQSPETVAASQKWVEQTARLFVRSFPGITAALGLVIGWINALMLRRFLGSREISLPVWNTWRSRELWIWVLIGSGLTALLAKGTVATVGINVFIPMTAIYFFQGMAIVHHLFETKHFPKSVRLFGYALLLFQLPVMLLVAGLGAFDLWVDFRSRWSAPPPAKNAEI